MSFCCCRTFWTWQNFMSYMDITSWWK